MKLQFFGEIGTDKTSTILVESDYGSSILLDCGMVPGKPNQPIIHDYIINEIEVILLTHAHLDHWGYLPWIVRKGFNKKIIMTKPTYSLLKEFAFKAYFEFLDEPDKQIYQETIHRIKKLIKLVDFGDPIKTMNFKIIFLPANHILGAAQIFIQELYSKKQLLYTGDINPDQPPLFDSISINQLAKDYKLNKDFKAVVIECSNINQNNSDEKKEEKRFIELVNETYFNGGNILIPCSALGDAQEFLIRYLGYCLNHQLGMPDHFFVLGSLISVNRVYYKYKDYFKNPKLIELFNSNMTLKDFRDYICENYSSIIDLYFNESNYGMDLFLATGGRLVGGSSKKLFGFIKDNPQNLIVLHKNIENLKCRAKVLHSSIFSLHGNIFSLKRYISELNEWENPIFYIIHGSNENKKILQDQLNKKKINNCIPEKGKEYLI